MMADGELESLELMKELRRRVWTRGKGDLVDGEDYLRLRRRTFVAVTGSNSGENF